MKHILTTWLTALAAIIVTATADAALPDPIANLFLAPGDTYHWAFVTDGVRDATSTSITDYNDFVTAEAERPGARTAGLGIEWSAIASTELVDARDNAVVQGPVFLVNGGRLANNDTDLWDGVILRHFRYDQFGTFLGIANVWTGTNGAGEAYYFRPDAGAYLGTTFTLAAVGYDYTVGESWVQGSFNDPATSNRFYALSAPLTVVPVPAALWCLGSGVVALALRRRRSASMLPLGSIPAVNP